MLARCWPAVRHSGRGVRFGRVGPRRQGPFAFHRLELCAELQAPVPQVLEGHLASGGRSLPVCSLALDRRISSPVSRSNPLLGRRSAGASVQRANAASRPPVRHPGRRGPPREQSSHARSPGSSQHPTDPLQDPVIGVDPSSSTMTRRSELLSQRMRHPPSGPVAASPPRGRGNRSLLRHMGPT